MMVIERFVLTSLYFIATRDGLVIVPVEREVWVTHIV